MTVAGCMPSDRDGNGGDRPSEEAADARWVEGITPQWMSEHMDMEIPSTAQGAQAAYQTTLRVDTGLLTFTLTRAEAEKYLKENPPDHGWLKPIAGETNVVGARNFAHLGLPEPETFLEGMRYDSVCPGQTEATGDPSASATVDDPYVENGAYGIAEDKKQCVKLFAHEYTPKRTRIYIRKQFEPDISPLPVTPSPTK